MRPRKTLTLGIVAAGGALLPSLALCQFVLRPLGAVEVRLAQHTAFTPLTQTLSVGAGTEIHTGVGTAELTMPDGSRLILAPSTQFQVREASPRSTVFSLLAGKLRAAVAGLYTSRMSIRTPTAVAAVRGTEFDISAGQDGDRFEVADGLLEVSDRNDRKTVVSSEEGLRVDQNGLGVPRPFAMNDDRAQPAARPYVVQQEVAREAAKNLLQEERNRELKANEAQLGKSVIDAHGDRVRIEEYLLRPAADEFKLVFLSHRQDSLNWGYFLHQFAGPIPEDLSQVPAIINSTFFSPVKPSNWLKHTQMFMTNTVDSFKETTDLGDPVQVDFAGLPGIQNIPIPGIGTMRYFPQTMNHQEWISGPGIAGLSGSAVVGQTLQIENTSVCYGSCGLTTALTTASGSGLLSWDQQVISSGRQLTDLTVGQINPASTNPTDPKSFAAGGNLLVNNVCPGPTCDPTVSPTSTVQFPSGPTLADRLMETKYADGTTLATENFLVSNDGQILDLASPDSLPELGNFNLEFNVTSTRFQGRAIDVLIAPEIFTQTKSEGQTPNQI